MRTSAGCVILILVVTLLSPAGVENVMAQDGNYPLQEYDELEAERERERIIYAPGEDEPVLSSKIQYTASRDSAIARPSRNIKPPTETVKNSAKPASQEDDSILSFNFLYFIFEKYKLQDMVD